MNSNPTTPTPAEAAEVERDKLLVLVESLRRVVVNWENESITLYAQETNAQAVWLDEGSKSEYQTLQRCVKEIAQALTSAEGASHE